MLSIERCREILGPDCPLSDEELAAMRDQLRDLALIAIEHALTGTGEEEVAAS